MTYVLFSTNLLIKKIVYYQTNRIQYMKMILPGEMDIFLLADV